MSKNDLDNLIEKEWELIPSFSYIICKRHNSIILIEIELLSSLIEFSVTFHAALLEFNNIFNKINKNRFSSEDLAKSAVYDFLLKINKMKLFL